MWRAMSDFESWHASIASSSSSSGHLTISIRSSGSGSKSSISVRPVASKIVTSSSAKPGLVKNRFHSVHSSASRPTSSVELALRAVEARLALDVELSRRHLEQLRVVHRLARLADEPDDAVAVRDDPDRAGMRDDLALRLLAVGVAEGVGAHVDDLALVHRLALDPLHRWPPNPTAAAATPAASASQIATFSTSRAAATLSAWRVIRLGAVREQERLVALEDQRVRVRAAAGRHLARLMTARLERLARDLERLRRSTGSCSGERPPTRRCRRRTRSRSQPTCTRRRSCCVAAATFSSSRLRASQTSLQ